MIPYGIQCHKIWFQAYLIPGDIIDNNWFIAHGKVAQLSLLKIKTEAIQNTRIIHFESSMHALRARIGLSVAYTTGE